MYCGSTISRGTSRWPLCSLRVVRFRDPDCPSLAWERDPSPKGLHVFIGINDSLDMVDVTIRIQLPYFDAVPLWPQPMRPSKELFYAIILGLVS